ncbi:MAG TPA: DUF3750 domain-containing protein [Burkholderiales bacterium]|nr:DUF3750 domain-containing protein [Burkholderiales bacterium]
MRYFLGVLLSLIASALAAQDWRSLSREPVGLAPDPATTREAMIQVYGARTLGWKGLFGVHTWVAVKPTDAGQWTVYEIIGWRLRWQDTALVISHRAPDGRWFGAEPELYAEKRGAGVDEMIARIDKAAHDYPYAKDYGLWPGPNSNTFTAWLTRAVPELNVDLPATAIGKDFLGERIVATPPSGHGVELSLAGLLGVTASSVEGFEVNVLGLSVGLGQSGLKLPFIGRIGPARSLVPEVKASEPAR